VRYKHSVALSPALQTHLAGLTARFRTLNDELQDERVLASATPAELARRGKELSLLRNVVRVAETWQRCLKLADDAEAVLAECDVSTADGAEMAALGALPALCCSWCDVVDVGVVQRH
jgi:protein subunit release factor A